MIINHKQLKGVKKKEIVLLQSGGLDSCFLACLLNRMGFVIHNIFIDYGQNSREKELECARAITKEYGNTLDVVTLDMPWLKNVCALNDGFHTEEFEGSSDTPLACVQTRIYVPMRNMLFLTIATSYAEAYKVKYIASGLDGDQDEYGKPLHGTPDKHYNFAWKLEKALIEGSAMHHSFGKDFKLFCPLLGVDKKDTIKVGLSLGCDFSLSWTCYQSTEEPCLTCGSCQQRVDAFLELGLIDPLLDKLYGKNAEKVLAEKKFLEIL